MADNISLIIAMAEKCKDVIQSCESVQVDQPAPLQPKHISWMCDEIARKANDWPATRAHRWIGFVQAAMIANHIIDLHRAKRMFDDVKNAYGKVDEDLLDHLDPDDSFEIELGGQG